VLALLRSDPVGLLAREYMFDADSEGVIETFEVVASLGSHSRRLAKCCCSSEPSAESLRAGIDRRGPPVRRSPDRRSPTDTGDSVIETGRGLGELGWMVPPRRATGAGDIGVAGDLRYLAACCFCVSWTGARRPPIV
jgi:hypothetical protein